MQRPGAWIVLCTDVYALCDILFGFATVQMKAVLCLLGALALASALNTAGPATRKDLIKMVNSNPASTWKAGVNRRFAHATTGEAMRYMGVKKNGFRLPLKNLTVDVDAIPASFDARVQWGAMCPSVSEVRDQSACGSCWAHGAVEAMTDRICIQSKGQTQVHLSAEDMNSCCWTCGMGCDGGDPGSAWDYWATTGVVDGGNYTDGGCAPYSLAPCEHHIPAGRYPACPSNEYPTPACPTTVCTSPPFWFSFPSLVILTVTRPFFPLCLKKKKKIKPTQK